MTTTGTTVAAQRSLATQKWPVGNPTFKQLTLRLDSNSQTFQTYRDPQRTGMIRAAQPSPIAHLPVELLSNILLLGAHTPDEDGASEDGYLSGRENRDDISPCLSTSSTSPDIFAAVNRHWRQVAIGTPQLWTRICVTIGDVMPTRAALFSATSRYVWRSGSCPLDVLIDARDPDWDFSEADGVATSPYFDELCDYSHPFKVEHMHHVLNILLPHVIRFNSLVILTDRWAPMHTALHCLSLEISAFVSTPRSLPPSLPNLETLVLMRCNEFVSYHSEFSPAGRKEPAFLPFSGLLRVSERAHADGPVLPALKKLVLSGVHIEWSSLARLLAPPHSPHPANLEKLELSYHCNEVRPRERDFKALLKRCARLRSLKLRVSGPQSPDDPSPICDAAPGGAEPVSLLHLDTVVLGYDDACAAATIIDMLDAPGVRDLTLEDASSPERDEALDAELLLQACTITPSEPGECRPPFPRVERLALHKVVAPAETFEALYEALPSLKALTVSQMFLPGGKTLGPDVQLTVVPLAFPSLSAPTWIDADGELNANKLAC